MGGEAGQHRQHEAAGGGGGIELLRHAAHADSVLLQLGDGIENEPGVAAQAVQFEDQQLIELVELGIFGHAVRQCDR